MYCIMTIFGTLPTLDQPRYANTACDGNAGEETRSHHHRLLLHTFHRPIHLTTFEWIGHLPFFGFRLDLDVFPARQDFSRGRRE